MNKVNFYPLILAVAVLMFVSPATAQFFEAAPASKSPAVSTPQVNQKAIATTPSAQKDGAAVVETVGNKPQKTDEQPVSSPFDYAYGKQKPAAPAAAAPAKQPVRRYSKVGGVTVETTEKYKEDELIMLYMRSFNIYRSPSGQTRCSARFAIATTLPVKLSNLSYRLKWPNMETVLNFTDVEPGVENHFDYGLLGDGCYNMDRQPNIVVNRCRVKGMTQRDCASKIRWIKEI